MNKIRSRLCAFLLALAMLPWPISAQAADASPAKVETLGAKAVGSIVKLKESGVLVDYLVVNQGKPSEMYDDSCEGTWLLRKDVFTVKPWHSEDKNDYANSSIHGYLNGEFLTRFDKEIGDSIIQLKIPYRPGSGTSNETKSGANGLLTKIFLLSDTEVGYTKSNTNEYIVNDGEKLAYFIDGNDISSSKPREALFNGSPTGWWLRSPCTNGLAYAWFVFPNGISGFSGYCSKGNGIRPALVLPSSFLVADGGIVTPNTPPTMPTFINMADNVQGGTELTVSWTASTDAENNLAGYKLERCNDNNAIWTQIYQGPETSYKDNIRKGCNTVQYRVKAYDCGGLESGTKLSAIGTVTNIAEYQIEYYWQDVGGEGYTLHETQVQSGTVGTAVTAKSHSYPGYYENTSHPNQKTTGSILLDGSLTLRLYYDRDTATTLGQKEIGSSVTLKENGVPVEYLVVQQGKPSEMYDDSCDGTWLLRKDLFSTYLWNGSKYNAWADSDIQSYLDGQFLTRFDSDTQSVIKQVKVPYRPGCGPGTSVNSGANGLSCKTFLLSAYEVGWTHDEYLHFPVEGTKLAYFDAGTGGAANNKRISYLNGSAPGWWLRSASTGNSMYVWLVDAKGGQSESVCIYNYYGVRPAMVMPSSLVVTDGGAVSTNVNYKVEHYKQDVVGEGYTLYETQTLQGGAGEVVNAVPRTYSGFYESTSCANRIPVGNVALDGSLVLKLYYNRDTYTVAFDSNSGNTVPSQNGIRYGGTVLKPLDPSKTGYDFGGWYADEKLTGAYDFNNSVNQSMTLYAKWIPRTDTFYKVEHYREDVSGNGYSLYEINALEGTTDTAVTASRKTYPGFHENATHPDRVSTGSIAPDGSLVLKLYYDRDTFEISFNCNGGEPQPAPIQVVYEHTYGALPIPSRGKDSFAGWYNAPDGGVIVTAESIVNRMENHTLYAQWVEEGYGILDGTVEDMNGNRVAGAQVTLRAGNVDYKSVVTDSEGKFSIMQIKHGVYNLVAEKNGVTVTSKFEIRQEKVTQILTLPHGKTNSIVEVKANTPEIVVGGLNILFNEPEVYTNEDVSVVADGGTVELRMMIQQKKRAEVGADADKLVGQAQGHVAMYLKLTAQKNILPLNKPTVSSELSELPQLVELYVPLSPEQVGKSGYKILRVHDGEVNEITEKPNQVGEYIEVQKDIIVLHARKFSIYALSYQTPSYGSENYVVMATAGVGGTVSPSKAVVSSGSKAVIQIKPDPGHRVNEVWVDGKQVPTTEQFVFDTVYRDHALKASFYCSSTAYRDLDTSCWYHEAVDFVLNRGYMVGTAANRWEPESAMTRAQTVMLLSKMDDGDFSSLAYTGFTDVNEGAWYAAPVAWSTANGISVGYGEGHFGPEDRITREQLVLMLYRFKGMPAVKQQNLTNITDGKTVSPWAQKAVSWAVESGILVGNEQGLLLPQGFASRAEVAAMVYKFMSK